MHPGGRDQKTRRTVYPYEIRSGKSSRFVFVHPRKRNVPSRSPAQKTSFKNPNFIDQFPYVNGHFYRSNQPMHAHDVPVQKEILLKYDNLTVHNSTFTRSPHSSIRMTLFHACTLIANDDDSMIHARRDVRRDTRRRASNSHSTRSQHEYSQSVSQPSCSHKAPRPDARR